MDSNQDAYELSGDVDAYIERNLGADPITKENWQYWQLFVRTIADIVGCNAARDL